MRSDDAKHAFCSLLQIRKCVFKLNYELGSKLDILLLRRTAQVLGNKLLTITSRVVSSIIISVHDSKRRVSVF